MRRARIEDLAAEGRVLNEELTAVHAARTDAEAAIRDLETSYAAEVILAPVSGAVSAPVPSVGDVYRPGDPLLSISSGDPYVLVYLPNRYLFPIEPGMKLQISDGQHTASGVLVEILPD